MRNSRHIIAVTLMATAICANRAIAAAPVEQPVAQFAGRLMERLSVRLRRVLPAARLYQPRHAQAQPENEEVWSGGQGVGIRQVSFSPFYFRLPPPGV
jgi:hypothetical protein